MRCIPRAKGKERLEQETVKATAKANGKLLTKAHPKK